MSEYRSIITFPPLPPTSNVLTSVERAKLLRTTAKLGRLLGSTPHLLDESHRQIPIHVQLPVPTLKRKAKGRFFGKRNSTSSASSTLSPSPSPFPESDSEEDSDWQTRRVNSPDSLASSCTRASTSSWSSHTSSASSIASPRSSFDSEESWRVRPASKTLPPLLRLGMSNPVKQTRRKRTCVKPSLETIPASPPCDGSFANDESFSSFPPTNDSDSDIVSYAPTFNIPTDAALRREKMRRLTKKLGDGVPLSLVFPPFAESDDDEVIISSPSSPVFASFSTSSFSPISPTSPASVESPSTSSISSSTTLVSDAEISPMSLTFRHEAAHQPPRKSHFAKPLPAVPEEDDCESVPAVPVRYVVHYDGDIHGRQCIGLAL